MKAHLVQSEVQIHDGFPAQTLCNAHIAACQTVLMWDAIAMNSPLELSSARCCQKCLDTLQIMKEESPRYIYGVIKAKESPEDEYEEVETAA